MDRLRYNLARSHRRGQVCNVTHVVNYVTHSPDYDTFWVGVVADRGLHRSATLPDRPNGMAAGGPTTSTNRADSHYSTRSHPRDAALDLFEPFGTFDKGCAQKHRNAIGDPWFVAERLPMFT